MVHVAWDYKDLLAGYYHIYSVTDQGDGLLNGEIIFKTLETQQNSDDIEIIADALDRMAGRRV